MQEVFKFNNEKNMAEAFLFNIQICVGAKVLAILHKYFLSLFQKDAMSNLPSYAQSFIGSLIHVYSILLTTTITTKTLHKTPVCCVTHRVPWNSPPIHFPTSSHTSQPLLETLQS